MMPQSLPWINSRSVSGVSSRASQLFLSRSPHTAPEQRTPTRKLKKSIAQSPARENGAHNSQRAPSRSRDEPAPAELLPGLAVHDTPRRLEHVERVEDIDQQGGSQPGEQPECTIANECDEIDGEHGVA